MERKIKISVVIPVYNTAKYIEECLDSLYVQECQNIEYILVDDGSTDNSLEICQKYAEKDSRFVVLHKENGGPSSARNLAISVAKGEYITFVDSDDSLCEGAYSIMEKRLQEKKDPDILVFGANLFPENAPEHLVRMVSPRNITYEEFKPEILYDEVGSRPFLWLQAIKKSLIDETNIKMDEALNLGEDQLFQIEIFPHAKRIAFVSDKLYNYRWYREDSLMNNYGQQMKKKIFMHINIVDKVLERVLTENYTRKMQIKTFTWSIFFLWGDLVYQLDSARDDACALLSEVWEKHECEQFYDELEIWAKLRYNQLVLLGETDKDKKIELLEEANQTLANDIAEIKATPEGKKIYKSTIQKTGRIKRLARKFFRTTKEEGLFRAIGKSFRKIFRRR